MGHRDVVRHQQVTGALERAERLARQQSNEERFSGLPQPGTRLRLLGTTDLWTNLKPGDEGVVSFIDAQGTVHMNWDSGSTLGLVYGEDRWEVIPTRHCKACGDPVHLVEGEWLHWAGLGGCGARNPEPA